MPPMVAALFRRRTMIIGKYPGIKLVSLFIAYDNDSIPEGSTEEQWLLSLDHVFEVDSDDLAMLDQWCQTLTNEEAETLAAGEHDNMMDIVALSPKPEFCNLLFNSVFEA